MPPEELCFWPVTMSTNITTSQTANMKQGPQLNTSQISTTIQNKPSNPNWSIPPQPPPLLVPLFLPPSGRRLPPHVWPEGQKRDGMWHSQNRLINISSIVNYNPTPWRRWKWVAQTFPGLPVSLPLSQRFQLLLWQQPPRIKECYPESSWSLWGDMKKHQPTVEKACWRAELKAIMHQVHFCLQAVRLGWDSDTHIAWSSHE